MAKEGFYPLLVDPLKSRCILYEADRMRITVVPLLKRLRVQTFLI